MEVKIVKFDNNARIPEKAHPSDFGFDVYAVSEKEIAPNVWQYGLGFGLQIDRDAETYERGELVLDNAGIAWGQKQNKKIDFAKSPLLLSIDLRPRSSIWKTGMILSNCEGTGDENYTGEYKAVFYHVMPNMPRYKVGDKILQCKLGMAFPMEFVEVDKLDETDRGDGGFGSSGK